MNDQDVQKLFDLLSRIEGHLKVIAKSVEDAEKEYMGIKAEMAHKRNPTRESVTDLAEYENYRKRKRDGKKAGF